MGKVWEQATVIFIAIPGVEIVLLNDKMEEVPVGTPGVLYVKRFKGMMDYYEKDESKTKEAFYKDFGTVGDIAYHSVLCVKNERSSKLPFEMTERHFKRKFSIFKFVLQVITLFIYWARYKDEEGFIYICDRKIDMIISGGANIYPAEVLDIIYLIFLGRRSSSSTSCSVGLCCIWCS